MHPFPLNYTRSYMVEWVRPVAYKDMTLSPIPTFSRAGWALHKRSSDRTDLAPIPSLSIPRVTKEKIRKKWTCGRSRGWIVRSKLKGAIASIVLVSYSK